MTGLKNDLMEKQSSSQQQIKNNNLSLVLRLIDRYGPVSRAELAQTTKLSPTTISSLVEELLGNKLVMETGAGVTNTSGRKPIMLEVNPIGGYVASVEMNEEGFNCCIYNLKCKSVDGSSFNVSKYSLIGQDIANAVNKLLQRNNISENRLFGVCLGIPGLIDYENNRVISSTVVPMDLENDFYSFIKGRFTGIPVLIGNESSFGAYAETQIGYEGNVSNLVYIDVGTGIGAGVIIGGHIYTGSYGMAGELGHVSIDMNGPKCKCGNKGCLEVMANIPAIIQKCIFGVMSERSTMISDIAANDFSKIDMDLILSALRAKDEFMLEVIDEIAYKLAFGINSVINLLNPEVVVIGGEIGKFGDIFLDKVKENIAAIALNPNIRKVLVKYSNLKGNVAVMGAARYALDSIFGSVGSLEGKSW